MADVRYKNDTFQFCLRTSALVLNEDQTKILLFHIEGNDMWLLPGGKIGEKEESRDAIQREIKEELGWEDLTYSFLAVSEEFANAKGYDNHQINLIYKAIYHGKITEDTFCGLEGNWIEFQWIRIEDLPNYNVFPKEVKEMNIQSNEVYHFVNNLL